MEGPHHWLEPDHLLEIHLVLAMLLAVPEE